MGTNQYSGPPYPEARRGEDVNVYHGVTVPDPYRWLDALDAPAVHEWMAAQDRVTDAWFGEGPESATFAAHLKRVHQPARPSLPIRRGPKTFEFVQEAEEDHPVLYVRPGRDGDARSVIVDPNGLSEDGTVGTHPLYTFVSRSGRYVAYNLDTSGSDLKSIHVHDAETGADLEDVIPPTAGPTVAWHPEETGFFYNVARKLFELEEEPAQRDGVYWHALGTPPEDDVCIYDYHDGAGHCAAPYIPEDGQYLFIKEMEFVTGKNGIRFAPLGSGLPGEDDFTELFGDAEVAVNLIGHAGSVYFFDTLLDAPNGRIVSIDLEHPERSNWREVVAEGEHAISKSAYSTTSLKAALGKDCLLVVYETDAHHTLRVYNLDGVLREERQLPYYATVFEVACEDGGYSFLIHMQSFVMPWAFYRYDARDGTLTPVEQAKPAIDTDEIEFGQVFYASKDGTQVPMYILHRRGVERNGAAPTLLYGYGGWGQSITPEYFPEIALWLELGGVYACANIRGGGEYGEAWHTAAVLGKRQNAYDDFCAAAEYLIERQYTRPANLAIKGLSNGGLLTCVCFCQRPELFGAVISEIPLLDVINLAKSDWGRAVAAELGDASEDRETFDYLMAYSPLHNLAAEPERPPLFVVVGEKDSPFIVGSAYKFVATRQAQAAHALNLLRIVRGAGHVQWTTRAMLETVAEEIAFLCRCIGRDLPAPMRLPGADS